MSDAAMVIVAYSVGLAALGGYALSLAVAGRLLRRREGQLRRVRP